MACCLGHRVPVDSPCRSHDRHASCPDPRAEDGLPALALLAGQALPVVIVETVYRRLALDHAQSGICFLLARTATAKPVTGL